MNARASNLLGETLISLAEAASRLPPGRSGKPVHFSCVLRWVTNGICGPDGQRIKLEAVRVGGRWLTSKEALARWAERLTPRPDAEPSMTCRAPTKRRKLAENVLKELERAGI